MAAGFTGRGPLEDVVACLRSALDDVASEGDGVTGDGATGDGATGDGATGDSVRTGPVTTRSR